MKILKFFFLSVALLCANFIALADYTITVKGKAVEYSEGDEVVAVKRNGREAEIIAKCTVSADGTFSMNVTLPKPGEASVVYEKRQSVDIWVEDENLEITFPGYTKGKPYMILPMYIPINGGVKNDLMNEAAFLHMRQDVNVQAVSQNIRKMPSLTSSQRDSILTSCFFIFQDNTTAAMRHLVENNQGVGSLWTLLGYVSGPDDEELLERSLKSLETGYPEEVVAYRQARKEKKENQSLSEVGMVAPDLAYPDVDGNIVKISDYRGKVLIVDFWASWCGPCRAEIPKVKAIAQEYKDNDKVAFLSISIDNKPNKWLEALEAENMPWKQLLASEAGKEAMAKYSFNGIPFIVAIAPDGTIFRRNLRGDAIRNAIKECLAATDAKPAAKATSTMSIK